MQSADLTLSLPPEMQLPLPEYVPRDAVVREELLSWNVDEATGVVSFLSLVVGDVAACRDAAASLAPVVRADFTPVDDDTFYVYAEMAAREADDALFAAFDERGVVVVPPVVYADTDTLHVTVLGDSDALRAVVAGLPEAVGVDVRRVGEHSRPAGVLAGRLTARQFEALETACDLGYYAVPREAPLADVAAALDCSESAASTLLRKAERALVAAALGR